MIGCMMKGGRRSFCFSGKGWVFWWPTTEVHDRTWVGQFLNSLLAERAILCYERMANPVERKVLYLMEWRGPDLGLKFKFNVGWKGRYKV